ncbi:MAG: hypothetical protein IH878_15505, partial [Gemmatimonadetes bacterium]|nr:hypothetical protein [Gemmatimonadota bacterium]
MLLVIGIVAVMASWAAVRTWEIRQLEGEALATAVKWAKFVQNSLSGLDQILSGDPPSENDRGVFELATKAGHVFRYKVYGPDGVIVHASRASDVGKTSTKTYFSERVMKGRTFVKIEEEEDFGEGRSTVSEAYVPIMVHGRFMGAIEVYVDMSPQAVR